MEELIVRYIMNNSTNTQLLLVSHSTNLLSNALLRPDQIYSVEMMGGEGSVLNRFSDGVGGSRHEFSLIKKIFEDLLGYQRIEKRRNKATYYKSQTDSHSTVAVINTKNSNIASISETDYLDTIYAE